MAHDGPKWPQIAQDGPKMTPSCTQDGAKMAQDGPNLAPRWSQDGPKTAQDGPKMEDESKMEARCPNIVKTCIFLVFLHAFNEKGAPKMAPRWPQDGPKLAPRWSQDGPKMAQDGRKMFPKSALSCGRSFKTRSRWHQDGPGYVPLTLILWSHVSCTAYAPGLLVPVTCRVHAIASRISLILCDCAFRTVCVPDV